MCQGNIYDRVGLKYKRSICSDRLCNAAPAIVLLFCINGRHETKLPRYYNNLYLAGFDIRAQAVGVLVSSYKLYQNSKSDI